VRRGIRLALEGDRPIAYIAADLGMHPEALRKKVRQAEADGGGRPELLSSSEREEIRRLRKENHDPSSAWYETSYVVGEVARPIAGQVGRMTRPQVPVPLPERPYHVPHFPIR
jgi:transposase-like protein